MANESKFSSQMLRELKNPEAAVEKTERHLKPGEEPEALREMVKPSKDQEQVTLTVPGTAVVITGRAMGKSRDPKYKRQMVLIQKATEKAAARKWEDEGGGDFSDLVEQLLDAYVEGRITSNGSMVQ